MKTNLGLELAEARVARSARALKIGTLRPAIVLYDEPHPLGDDIGMIQTADMARKPDMLIVMGTSLKVHGLKKLVKDFAKTVHTSAPSRSFSVKKAKSFAGGKVVFVNRTAPGSEWADIIDYHVAGDTDVWVKRVLRDWKKMRPADWEVQQTLSVNDGDVSMSGGFKVVKNATGGVKGKADGMFSNKDCMIFKSDIWTFEQAGRKARTKRTSPRSRHHPHRRSATRAHRFPFHLVNAGKRVHITLTLNVALRRNGTLRKVVGQGCLQGKEVFCLQKIRTRWRV
jgi:hypothetical protein